MRMRGAVRTGIGLLLAAGAGAGLRAEKLLAAEPGNRTVSFRRHVLDTGQVWNSVAALDVDRDGHLDLAAASPEEVACYRRPSAGEAWTKSVILKRTPATGSLDSITLVPFDLDRDQDADLVTSCPGSGALGWYENNGGKSWNWRLIDRVPRIHSQALQDVNGDGRLDLVANTEGKLIRYAVPADPRAAGPARETPAGAGEAAAIRWERFTLTEDGVAGTPHYLSFHRLAGRLTLCGAAPDAAYLAWWEQPRNPAGPWTRHAVRTAEMGATHLIPCDMNRDGVTDLFYARGHTAGSGWLAGPDWKRDTPVDPGQLQEPHALALGDLDGDGSLDVAAAARNKGGLVAWLNDARGNFTAHPLDPGQRGMDLRVADLDGDGDQDLLVAGATGKNLVWYENRRR